jgi:hypothetical protein
MMMLMSVILPVTMADTVGTDMIVCMMMPRGHGCDDAHHHGHGCDWYHRHERDGVHEHAHDRGNGRRWQFPFRSED